MTLKPGLFGKIYQKYLKMLKCVEERRRSRGMMM
jgi:hypothetical protein